MTEFEKELFENLQPYEAGTPFHKFYIFSLDKLYNGFFGENGYNSFGIIVEDDNGNRWKVNNSDIDVINLDFKGNAISMEIPADTNMIKYWTFANKQFVITNTSISSITIKLLDYGFSDLEDVIC